MKYSELINNLTVTLNQQQLDKSIVYQLIYARDSRIKDLMSLSDYLNTSVPTETLEALEHDIKDLIDNQKPLAYILGYTWFLGQKFFVHEQVFSPRPETEYWVDYIINLLEPYPSLRILDLCCGTGVIGLSVKKQLPRMNVSLVDYYTPALENTNANARQLGVDVEILSSDLFSNLGTIKYDVILCNPPYIDPHVNLHPSLKYEPQNALYADQKGLYFYERVLTELGKHVNQRYLLVFEIGYDQAEVLKTMVSNILGDKIKVEILKDQYNQDRVLIINRM